MLKLVRSHPYLVFTFTLACVLTLFFAARLVTSAIYWSDPAHQNQKVAGWMTVGYIAKSWDLKAFEIDVIAKLPLPHVKGHPQPLIEIARDRGVPVATVIAEVEAAIGELQHKQPLP